MSARLNSIPYKIHTICRPSRDDQSITAQVECESWDRIGVNVRGRGTNGLPVSQAKPWVENGRAGAFSN
jgi:hypothetical protein